MGAEEGIIKTGEAAKGPKAVMFSCSDRLLGFGRADDPGQINEGRAENVRSFA